MARYWSWLWARYAHRYRWAVFVTTLVTVGGGWSLLSVLLIGTFEGFDRLPAMLALTTVAAVVMFGLVTAAYREWDTIERWGRGDRSAPSDTLAASFAFVRRVSRRCVVVYPTVSAASGALLAAVSGASAQAVFQWSITTGITGFAMAGTPRKYAEAAQRPLRLELSTVGAPPVFGTGPAPRSFGFWATLMFVSMVWLVAVVAGLLNANIESASTDPLVATAVATALVLGIVIPIVVAMGFTPGHQPIRDLIEATRRVEHGDFSRSVPAVSDDDLGLLAESFNRMQAGLAERERLQAAFGSYVSPTLAERLLAQGDEIFSGDRVDVTVMFVDIRDFTAFAEANSAEGTVAHLNAFFEIVVATTIRHGGHVNKFLGDGALVVFGAPERTDDHADRATACARDIRQRVRESFGDAGRIGIGINTGTVIAGTVGGAGKLEFTLIGDTVNVAARIEQLTKTTGDTILVAGATLEALADPPDGFIDRGAHRLRGKRGAVTVHALVPAYSSSPRAMARTSARHGAPPAREGP